MRIASISKPTSREWRMKAKRFISDYLPQLGADDRGGTKQQIIKCQKSIHLRKARLFLARTKSAME